MAGERVMQVLGPGFNSQVPHTILSIFHNAFTCSICPKFHHAPSRLSLPSGHEIHPVARRWSLWCVPVNKPARDARKSNVTLSNGPEFLTIDLHFGPSNPLGLHSLILFYFLFFLILLIVLIIIINSP